MQQETSPQLIENMPIAARYQQPPPNERKNKYLIKIIYSCRSQNRRNENPPGENISPPLIFSLFMIFSTFFNFFFEFLSIISIFNNARGLKPMETLNNIIFDGFQSFFILHRLLHSSFIYLNGDFFLAILAHFRYYRMAIFQNIF